MTGFTVGFYWFQISPDITDLSNYFVTSDGEDFISVFDRALKTAVEASFIDRFVVVMYVGIIVFCIFVGVVDFKQCRKRRMRSK